MHARLFFVFVEFGFDLDDAAVSGTTASFTVAKLPEVPAQLVWVESPI